MKKKTTRVSIDIDVHELEAINAYQASLIVKAKGKKVTQNTALRDLIAKGLRVVSLEITND